MSTTVSVADSARQELGASFRGQLIGPEDAEYDEARKVYNAMIDRRPALIARCAGADDVAGTIAFARSHDLLLAVRGGGHNGGGLGVVDDGVVCDLSLLREVVVDPEARTARVGGGCTWADVDNATQPHDLARWGCVMVGVDPDPAQKDVITQWTTGRPSTRTRPAART